MKQIATQIDGQTSLSASDFNQIPLEVQTIITSSGQTLDGNLTNQASRAVVDLGMNAGFYIDSGTVNNIVLSNSNNPAPTSLRDGIEVTFKATTSNTGATTINLASLGAKNLLSSNGAALTPSAIISGFHYKCLYVASSDSFILCGHITNTGFNGTFASTITYDTDINTTSPSLTTTVNARFSINGNVCSVFYPEISRASTFSGSEVIVSSVSLPFSSISTFGSSSVMSAIQCVPRYISQITSPATSAIRILPGSNFAALNYIVTDNSNSGFVHFNNANSLIFSMNISYIIS
jgi:hypothetical protein